MVLIHPNGFTEASRFSRFYFNNVVGNPLDTTLALHYLIFDGVLERHPRLKIVRRAWRWYPAGLFRPDRPRLGCAQRLPRRPAASADHLSAESVLRQRGVHAAPACALVEVFGADQILMGTDYPYDMAESDPLGHLAGVKALETKSIEAIAGGNAKKLIGI